MTDLSQQFDRLIAQTDLTVSELQKEQLLGYVALLHKWNKAYNLTSVRNPSEMVINS